MTEPPGSGSRSGTGVLERFLAEISADDYAQAPRREGFGTIHPGRVSTWIGLAVAAVVGIVIVAALLSTRLSTAERQQTRAALIDRVQSLSDAVGLRQQEVDAQSLEVSALQTRLLAASDAGPERAAAIAALSDLASTTELAGPGVIITVDDAPDAAEGSLNRVLDRDLQDIVNALWRSGAQGVAINDERLTATTAIRGAGEAILVNYQPLARPYVVTAVGADDAAAVSGLLDALSTDYGLVSDLGTGDQALPAGELRSPRFASTIPPSRGGARP